MMTRAALFFTLASSVVACSGSITTNTDGGDGGASDGSSYDANPDPCKGLGCASMPGKLVVHVLDAQTMSPLAAPTFMEGNRILQPTCAMMNMGLCSAWELVGLPLGNHTISVFVEGHGVGSVTATIMGPGQCCGIGPTVEKTALLPTLEALCKSTNGVVSTQLCCGAGKDFPDLCSTGACGCSPQNSKDTKVCLCAKGQCFKQDVGCTTM